VLAPVLVPQGIQEPALLVDVGTRPDPPQDVAPGISDQRPLDPEPPIHAIVTADADLDVVDMRAARPERLLPLRHQVRAVVGVVQTQPVLAVAAAGRSAGVIVPDAILVEAASVGVTDPDAMGHPLGQTAELLLARAQCQLGAAALAQFCGQG